MGLVEIRANWPDTDINKKKIVASYDHFNACRIILITLTKRLMKLSLYQLQLPPALKVYGYLQGRSKSSLITRVALSISIASVAKLNYRFWVTIGVLYSTFTHQLRTISSTILKYFLPTNVIIQLVPDMDINQNIHHLNYYSHLVF